MSQPSLRLRVYNIPADKTEEVISNEFKSIVDCQQVQLVMKNDNEHAGYAYVDFAIATDMDNFVLHFPKLRHDLVIYKQLTPH
jgi:hypothetical protein